MLLFIIIFKSHIVVARNDKDTESPFLQSFLTNTGHIKQPQHFCFREEKDAAQLQPINIFIFWQIVKHKMENKFHYYLNGESLSFMSLWPEI